MAELKDWNVAADDNGFQPPNGWPEGMSYYNVNNCGREMMAVLARWFYDRSGVLTTTSLSNIFFLNTFGRYGTPRQGDRYTFKINVTMPHSARIRINGAPPINIVSARGNMVAFGHVPAGHIITCVIDGSGNLRLAGRLTYG